MHLVIFGAGAEGRVALDIARAVDGDMRVSFVDDDRDLWDSEVEGACVLGGIDALAGLTNEEHGVVVAVGNPPTRLALAAQLAEQGVPFVNVVHPDASVASSARLGLGNIIGPAAVMDAGSTVGDHCIINAGAVVSHDSTLGDGVLLGSGVVIGGRVTVGEGAFLAIGVHVVARATIGGGAVVGLASTVVDDVEQRVMVVGTPARLVRTVDDDFDWSRLL